MSEKDKKLQVKIKFVSLASLILFLGLIVRLFWWQIVKGDALSKQAAGQHFSSLVVAAPRGNIVAPNGEYWAVGVTQYTVFANTTKGISDPEKVANQLAPFFVKEDEKNDRSILLSEVTRLMPLLSKKNAYFVPLATRISEETKNNIEALKISGIDFQPEESRYYPEASIAAQLLGFVGKDEEGSPTGYFGLEGYYNLSLSGKSGFNGVEKDAAGSPILVREGKSVSATDGVNLVTSIDKRVQLAVYSGLAAGIEKYGAKSGSVVVMDPKTGNILALEAYPSFDPAAYWEYGDSLFRNPVISDTFEPGSIFKVLVMAAGIDKGVVTPDTTCDICDGPVNVDGYTIRTWNNEYRPDASMVDVIVHSDNIGMTFVAQKLGQETLYDYLDKFGVGEKTGVDLQGEVALPLRKKGTWSNVDLDTTSFGQGIALTGMQMVRAVAAIANGGVMPTPRVVTKVEGEGWGGDIPTSKGVRVISSEAAQKVGAMMYEAAAHGESQWAYPKGFKIAGKTGTAQIPIAGHYDATRTNASFIGFAPLDNPKFVMLVTLNEPSSSPWAAETAAPLWYKIAEQLFPYFGIQPEN